MMNSMMVERIVTFTPSSSDANDVSVDPAVPPPVGTFVPPVGVVPPPGTFVPLAGSFPSFAVPVIPPVGSFPPVDPVVPPVALAPDLVVVVFLAMFQR
jgi:hypothetical protein